MPKAEEPKIPAKKRIDQAALDEITDKVLAFRPDKERKEQPPKGQKQSEPK